MDKEKEVSSVDTAAKWWADKLRTYYRTIRTTRLPLDFVVAMKIDQFEKTLSSLIQEQIDIRGTAYLKSEYMAEGIVYDAAKDSDLDTVKGFPLKTRMEVTRIDIIVSEGYKTGYRKVITR